MISRVRNAFGVRRCTRGVVLILVIWVLVLIAALAVEFDSAMRVLAEGTSNANDELRAYYLARSAVEMGIADAMNHYGPAYASDSGELIYSAATSRDQEEELFIAQSIASRRAIPLAGGEVSYALFDEEGRYNLNSLRSSNTWIMAKLLNAASGLEVGTERDSIVDSVIDWKDLDPLRMVNGAEDDYYRSLPLPYFSKDGDLFVPDELLYVKGMTRQMYLGGGPAAAGYDYQIAPGLKDFITTFSSRRGGGEFEFHVATARPELRQIMGLRTDIRATSNPTLIRIVGQGKVKAGRITRTVEAVVRIRPTLTSTAGTSSLAPRSWEVIFWDDDSQSKLPEAPKET